MISSDTDPDLAFVVEHWHDLPDAVKARILDVVKPYAKTPDATARRQAVEQALQQAHNPDRAKDRTFDGSEP